MDKDKAPKSTITLSALLGIRAELERIFSSVRVPMKLQFTIARFLLTTEPEQKAFEAAKKELIKRLAVEQDGQTVIPAASMADYQQQLQELLDQPVDRPELPLTLQQLEELPGEVDVIPYHVLALLEQRQP